MNIILPNGTEIQGIPEGTPKSEIMDRAIKAGWATAEDFGQPDTSTYDALAEKKTGLNSFLIGMGRGFYTVGRGIGLLEPEDDEEAAAFDALSKKRPYSTGAGELIGEAAPFAAIGGPIGGMASQGGRIAASGALGAVEGAVLSNAKSDNLEEVLAASGVGGGIGVLSETLFPRIGRIGRKVVSRLRGRPYNGTLLDAAGRPTAEFQSALDDVGISFDDLTDSALQSIRKHQAGASPAQAARVAAFESLDSPYLRGDITQDFASKATEARIAESAADPLGDPIRNIRLAQSEAFTAQLSNQLTDAGVSPDVGATIKDALSGRKAILRAEKNRLYTEAAKNAEKIGPIPIATDSIQSAIPDDRTIKRLSRISGSQINAAQDLLVEFGIDRRPDAVEAFLKRGETIEPLSIQNFEDFRSALNQLSRADTTGATDVFVQPVLRALDQEAALVDDAIRAAGITDDAVLSPLKDARKTVRAIKTEFSPQAFTGRLIDTKRDGVTPVIEASKVYGEIMGTQKPTENLGRLLTSLRNSGDAGKKAISDLQDATILDLMESAFKANSRRINGQKVFGANAFQKRLDQIGEQRLKMIFRNRPEALAKIRLIEKAAQAATASAAEMPKGSASVNRDLFLRAMGLLASTKLPGANLMLESTRNVSENAIRRKAVQAALNARPDVVETQSALASFFPGVAAAIGIASVVSDDEE